MRAEEFIGKVSQLAKENEKLEELRKGIPLGEEIGGGIALAQKREKVITIRNTCVTGVGRSNFIRRTLITLACLFDKEEACFFVLSPNTEYGELLRLHSADVTALYLREKKDLDEAIATLKELLRMRDEGKGFPKLFLILDGLDELEGCNKNNDLEEYREIYDLLIRREDVQVITGADVEKSIFSGFPGALLGVGNCLVTVRGGGKADVTYVNEDSSLTLPQPVTFPCEPTVMESVIYLNSLFS
ncbi:MAG: hypothetical protein IKZ28_06265 [Clostridia bacterium]|nr:hypothetical protein [Clostridia bacterium]